MLYKKYKLHIMILILITIFSKNINYATTITIDGTNKHQQIEGFGIEILGMMNTPKGYGETISIMGQQLYSDFGFKTVMIREHIGDFEPVNDNDDPFAFDWTVYNQKFNEPEFVTWFQNIKTLSNAGLNIHLVTFHPPSWLVVHNPKKSEDVRWIPDPNYPKIDFFHEFAESWSAVLVHLRNVYGVHVKYIATTNEPEYGEPLKLSAAELKELVKAIGQRFASEGLTTKILVSEDANIHTALRYTKVLLNDRSVVPFAGGVSYHTYKGVRSQWVEPDSLVNDLINLANDSTIRSSGLPLYMTEWSPQGPDHLNGQALVWAKHIYNVHTFARTSQVYLWYVGPLNWSTDFANSIESDGSGGLRWRKKMYAWKQFAKFIEPGSELLEIPQKVKSGTSPAVSAYLHPTSGKFTIVATNRGAANQVIDVSLQNIANTMNLDVYQTSANKNSDFINSISVTGAAFSYSLPKESITTFTGTIGGQVSFTDSDYRNLDQL